jgi:hypothetical protein
MWKLKDENKVENLKVMKEKLESLKKVIPSILELEVGINFENSKENSTIFDIVLNTTFKDKNALIDYKMNSFHIKVDNFIKQIIIKRAVIDFEI